MLNFILEENVCLISMSLIFIVYIFNVTNLDGVQIGRTGNNYFCLSLPSPL